MEGETPPLRAALGDVADIVRAEARTLDRTLAEGRITRRAAARIAAQLNEAASMLREVAGI